jgi:hypothetical protein
MITELAESIMNKYEQSTTLRNALTGGLYFQQAPQTTSSPYGVFRFNGTTTEDFLGATRTKQIQMAEVEFGLYTDADDGGQELAKLIDLITLAFDFTELSMSGYYNVSMKRDSIEAIDFVDEIWQVIINYEVWYIKE